MTARKPAALHVLHGTNRADRMNQNEPKPAIGAEPPPWLPTEGPARDAWNRLAPAFEELRVLTIIDAEALALACVAAAEFVAAQNEPNGWRRGDAAAKRYLAVLREFGATPASRPKVSTTPVAARDPLDEWMASGGSTPPPPPKPARRQPPADPPTDALAAWQRGETGA